MVDSCCENMWANNSGEGLGHHLTAGYGAAAEVPSKQLIISQHIIRSKMLSLCIKNSLTTDAKWRLKSFKNSYTYNNQYNGSAIFFVIVKMIGPDTHAGCSYININMETMIMSHFNNDTSKENQHIVEWLNKISIDWETYSEISGKKFNL